MGRRAEGWERKPGDSGKAEEKSRRGGAGVSNPQSREGDCEKHHWPDVRPDSTGGDKVKTAFQILLCYYGSG